jgi:predicted CoA-binding protein
LADLYSLALNGEQRERISSLEKTTRERAAMPVDLDSLDRSDREAEFEDWLGEKGISEPWNLAPDLVNLDLKPEDMDTLVEDLLPRPSDHALNIFFDWLTSSYKVYRLLREIDEGAERISDIVQALKMYSYLDQAPVQSVNIHDGLDKTLILLRFKLKQGEGIQVQRHYATDLPMISGYGSELNQLWTNLIDNAIDALNGKGVIQIRTYQEEGWVVVEVEDNGPGIPEEIQHKIFDPFFTTKPPGQGTGLGLHTSYSIVRKHKGLIKVLSEPGRTVFKVYLPVHFENVKSDPVPLAPTAKISDAEIRGILDETRSIAVVGLSDKKNRPANSVPAYLQANGYKIVPVNPILENGLGEKAYPDLLSVPVPIDTVLIFRRSDVVPEIVEQAKKIGAKTIWMQEGIVNENAAISARQAGMKVVMDTCMRQQHRRLIDSPLRMHT